MEFDIWKILGSKWTMLSLAVAMGLIIPMLWNNVSVVWSTANVPTYMLWQHTTVFVIAIATMIMAVFKALSQFNAEKNQPQDENINN